MKTICLMLGLVFVAHGAEIKQGLPTECYYVQCMIDVERAALEDTPEKVAVELYEGCLTMSKLVDDHFLEWLEPGMSKTWRSVFQPLMRASIKVMKSPNKKNQGEYDELAWKWGEFYTPKIKAITTKLEEFAPIESPTP